MSTKSMTAIEAVVAGRYKVERLLGEGGMSKVYLAEDVNVFGSKVAIKVLSLEESGILERFVEEARGQSHLGQHPNICGVKDTVNGPNGKLKYIVMDFIPGESFQDFILRNRGELHNPVTRKTMLQIVIESSRALQYAHTAKLPGREDAGIIHRDIKPENIMLQDLGDGRLSPVLVDFGLCRIGMGVGYTSDSRIFGTPIYASPEQLLYPTSVTYRTDIFSMGMILFWIFAGERFYDAEDELSAFGIIPYFQTHRKERLQLIRDPAAQAIVSKAIAENPMDRYQSAAELVTDLQAFLDNKPVQSSHQGIVTQSPTLHYASRPTLKPEVIANTLVSQPLPKAVVENPESPDSPGKRSKVGVIAGAAAVLLAGLIVGTVYFSSKGNSKSAKSNDAKASINKPSAQESAAPVKKPVKQKTVAHKPPGVAAQKPALSNSTEEQAKKLFAQWSDECQKTDTRRDYFKTTPSLHSVCIRQKKATSHIKETNSFAAGRLIVKLLKAKFCTGYNLRYDRNMKKECRRIAHLVIDIDTWEKLYTCQLALTELMKKGDTEEKGLPGKCRQIRWYLDPKPTVVKQCQKARERDGAKKLADNCKAIFKSFPALIPR